MSRGICGITVYLMLIFNAINIGFGQSPCPQYFRYMRDDYTGEIWARIEIPRAPKGIPLTLRVRLSIGVILATKYVGRLELATTKREAMRAVNQGRPLVYRLNFPLRNPIPIVEEIIFNGQLYCYGNGVNSPMITTISLEHTLYPPRVITLSESRPIPEESDYLEIPQSPPGMDLSPNPMEDMPPPFSSLNDEPAPFTNVGELTPKDDENLRPSVSGLNPENTIFGPDSLSDYKKICGRVNSPGVHYLIANGDRTSPGQWPWLAAIFVARIEFEFQCAGSLITDKHIITAAHCKYYKGINVPASAFIVSLGRHHLQSWREQGSQTHEVLEFRVHPNYRNTHFNADADIAVMILRDKVEFTPKVRPLCLWNKSIELERIVGLNGNVVGWGKDENGKQLLKQPRMAVAPIASQEDCLRSNVAFIPSTSNRTFCAGRRDGSGPCNGDSGSGLVLLDKNTGRYHLRGIVSLSLLDNDRKSCDLSQYVVYVDSAKFLDWIKIQTNY